MPQPAGSCRDLARLGCSTNQTGASSALQREGPAGVLYASTSGVRISSRDAKGVELDKLREQIRLERASCFDASTGSMGEGGRLAGLITYHDLVERVPEWPFDAPMALRLGLFVTLGIGSWLGGALVERLVEVWL